MKEPEKIPLTNNPRSKTVTKIPLESNNYPTFVEIIDWYNENYRQNNSQSIQQLESDKTH